MKTHEKHVESNILRYWNYTKNVKTLRFKLLQQYANHCKNNTNIWKKNNLKQWQHMKHIVNHCKINKIYMGTIWKTNENI